MAYLTEAPKNSFLVNFDEQPDGNLPPDKWIKVRAKDHVDALVIALKHKPKGFRPERAFVSLGPMRHANGTPMAVQSYRLQW